MDEERPKIYVDAKGALYVKADELFRSKRVRAKIKEMAEIDFKRDSATTPSKDRS